MTRTYAKDQGQRLVGLKDRVETSGQTVGQTETIALPPVLTQLVMSSSQVTSMYV